MSRRLNGHNRAKMMGKGQGLPTVIASMAKIIWRFGCKKAVGEVPFRTS